MVATATLEAALEGAEVTKVEFEVTEGGQVRWILWDDSRRLFSAVLTREELIDCLKASGILLRTMAIVKQDDFYGRTASERG